VAHHLANLDVGLEGAAATNMAAKNDTNTSAHCQADSSGVSTTNKAQKTIL
jgi:hypothetical protein